MTSGPAPLLSVVAPCYREEAVLPGFLDTLFGVLDGMGESFEVVLVDDGSSDDTFRLIREWSAKRTECRGIRLTRNFGHQAALTAGLDAARGSAVITLDSDLQHPPSLIPELVARWRAGTPVVLTKRSDRGRTPFLKRATSALFYRVLSRISGVTLHPGTSDFRLLDRRAVDALGECRESHRMLRALVPWLGFASETVPFEVGDRAGGESKYDLRRMVGMAVDGVISFSPVPLRIAGMIGFAVAVLAGVYLVYVIGVRIVRPEDAVAGWASVLGVVLFFGGVHLLFLGILGEYVGRLYQEAKKRPLYVVGETVGGSPATGRESS